MRSAYSPDSRYGNINIKLIGNVFCPSTICSGILCVQKKTSQSLDRSDYRCPQCESMCHMCNIPFAEQTTSLFSKLGQGIHVFEETQK